MNRLMQFIGGGWVVAAVGTLLANTGLQEGEQGGMTEWLITLAITAAVAVTLYFILRRVTTSATTALVLGIIAAVSVLIFWLGLAPIFAGGAAAIALPQSQSTEGRSARSGKATAALALAAISVAAFLVLVVIG